MIFGPQVIRYQYLICIKHLISLRMQKSFLSGWEPGKKPDPRSAGHGTLALSNLESVGVKRLKRVITSPGHNCVLKP